jgi:hypothetical protein
MWGWRAAAFKVLQRRWAHGNANIPRPARRGPDRNHGPGPPGTVPGRLGDECLMTGLISIESMAVSDADQPASARPDLKCGVHA